MEYSVTFSKRKTIGIRVMPDLRVVVHAPLRLDKKIIDEIVQKHTRWIEKQIERIKARPQALFAPTKEEINELKNKTLDAVLPLVSRYSKIIGVTPTKITITSAKKVFGSCTSKKHLNFSFRLALYPKNAIEYVVVHELCHIKEMNHSKKFWSEVEKALPDYKARKKLLENGGQNEHSNS